MASLFPVLAAYAVQIALVALAATGAGLFIRAARPAVRLAYWRGGARSLPALACRGPSRSRCAWPWRWRSCSGSRVSKTRRPHFSFSETAAARF